MAEVLLRVQHNISTMAILVHAPRPYLQHAQQGGTQAVATAVKAGLQDGFKTVCG